MNAKPPHELEMAPEDGAADIQPKRSGLRRWLEHWHLLVLFGLIGLMGWMVAYLLYPGPSAEITLKPLSSSELQVALPNAGESAGFAADTDESASSAGKTSDEANNAGRKSRKRHFTSHKKPAHPPVLNLNTASAEQLQLLPGIGPKMAERIIEYRKTHGAFSEPAQVMEVKGIGPKKYEKLKAFLKV